MADRAMAGKASPVDFVSAHSATTVNGVGLSTVLGLRYYEAEVIAASREDLVRHTAITSD